MNSLYSPTGYSIIKGPNISRIYGKNWLMPIIPPKYVNPPRQQIGFSAMNPVKWMIKMPKYNKI